MKKYEITPSTEGDLDAVRLQEEFKRRDAERKALKTQLEAVIVIGFLLMTILEDAKSDALYTSSPWKNQAHV